MVRRISTSQLKSQLRQIENRQRQAVNRYNQAVRQYNQHLKRTVNDYNREVRAHNAKVRANRARINSALIKLQTASTTRYTVYRTSTRTLHEAYEQLEARRSYGPADAVDKIFDWSERENANSLQVSAALLNPAEVSDDVHNEAELATTAITNELTNFSQDLHDRWIGALYSLNPRNPDAARHFCASTREIFATVLNISAPDADVLSSNPTCSITDEGKPTRRAKIRYLLAKRGITDEELEDFVDKDVDNIIELFRVFNDGTHGSSGVFLLNQLFQIKRRVEDGIVFLTGIATN